MTVNVRCFLAFRKVLDVGHFYFQRKAEETKYDFI